MVLRIALCFELCLDLIDDSLVPPIRALIEIGLDPPLGPITERAKLGLCDICLGFAMEERAKLGSCDICLDFATDERAKLGLRDAFLDFTIEEREKLGSCDICLGFAMEERAKLGCLECFGLECFGLLGFIFLGAAGGGIYLYKMKIYQGICYGIVRCLILLKKRI